MGLFIIVSPTADHSWGIRTSVPKSRGKFICMREFNDDHATLSDETWAITFPQFPFGEQWHIPGETD